MKTRRFIATLTAIGALSISLSARANIPLAYYMVSSFMGQVAEQCGYDEQCANAYWYAKGVYYAGLATNIADNYPHPNCTGYSGGCAAADDDFETYYYVAGWCFQFVV